MSMVMQESASAPLKIGGVAPNVVRELSGIYPTFVSAFKELISNAYDADATLVAVQFSPDMSSILVEDNGMGMTPPEFQTEYIRIGGSLQRRSTDITPDGRRPIGRKGIGFLAVARYCNRVSVCSQTNRTAKFSESIVVDGSPQSSPAASVRIPILVGPVASALAPLAEMQKIQCGDVELEPPEYEQDENSILLSTETHRRLLQVNSSNTLVLKIDYLADCRAISFEAVIDYDYLLNLQDDRNLETIQDFCQIRVIPQAAAKKQVFTRVTLHLRDFVKQELLAPQRRGRVRNVGSASGLDRFLWQLGRSIPVPYELSNNELEKLGLGALTAPASPTAFAVQVRVSGNETKLLRRPLLANGGSWHTDAEENDNQILFKQRIQIDKDGLAAHGYLLGFSQPVFPAELRGIAVRVRGVEIGEPSFLRMDHEIPVKYRPLLNQVVGEIVVTEGLDAISAIVPGRAGFYAENRQYQTLTRCLVGGGPVDLGILGEVLEQLYKRYSIESSAMRVLQETRRRRDAFLDVSQAVTNLSVGSHYGRNLRHLFGRSDITADGLCRAPKYSSQSLNSIGEYATEMVDSMEGEYELDTERGVVRFNRRLDIWNSSLYMMGRHLDISLRQGEPDGPVCEIDLSADKIYLNWMHPTRTKMGDAMFIKSALFWRIAYLAADGDVDMMMNLAHRLLSV